MSQSQGLSEHGDILKRQARDTWQVMLSLQTKGLLLFGILRCISSQNGYSEAMYGLYNVQLNTLAKLRRQRTAQTDRNPLSRGSLQLCPSPTSQLTCIDLLCLQGSGNRGLTIAAPRMQMTALPHHWNPKAIIVTSLCGQLVRNRSGS